MPAPVSLSLPSWVDDLDERVDTAWEPIRQNAVANRVFYLASAAGDFSAVWHSINLIRLVRGIHSPRRAITFAVAVGIESLVVNQGVKRLFDRQRPIHADERPHHLRTPSTSSFPSGHASSATFATMILRRNGSVSPAVATTAAIVATSRLHVRIHHASDVVAGVFAGATLAIAARRALR